MLGKQRYEFVLRSLWRRDGRRLGTTKMLPILSIHTFGGLRVYVDDMPVKGFGARSAEALLAYLSSHTEPLPRGVLAELLWPERPAEVSLANLRAALFRLRRELAPYLLITRQDVGLISEAWVDTGEFESHLSERRLAEALDLYRGEFLAGFYLDGSPAFESWLSGEQERLRHLILAACQELLGEALRLGQRDGALRYAQRLLLLEPLYDPPTARSCACWPRMVSAPPRWSSLRPAGCGSSRSWV